MKHKSLVLALMLPAFLLTSCEKYEKSTDPVVMQNVINRFSNTNFGFEEYFNLEFNASIKEGYLDLVGVANINGTFKGINLFTETQELELAIKVNGQDVLYGYDNATTLHLQVFDFGMLGQAIFKASSTNKKSLKDIFIKNEEMIKNFDSKQLLDSVSVNSVKYNEGEKRYLLELNIKEMAAFIEKIADSSISKYSSYLKTLYFGYDFDESGKIENILFDAKISTGVNLNIYCSMNIVDSIPTILPKN